MNAKNGIIRFIEVKAAVTAVLDNQSGYFKKEDIDNKVGKLLNVEMPNKQLSDKVSMALRGLKEDGSVTHGSQSFWAAAENM